MIDQQFINFIAPPVGGKNAYEWGVKKLLFTFF